MQLLSIFWEDDCSLASPSATHTYPPLTGSRQAKIPIPRPFSFLPARRSHFAGKQQRGISQDKLSKLAYMTFNTIIKIKSGITPKPRIDTVKKLAQALGVSVEDLIKKLTLFITRYETKS